MKTGLQRAKSACEVVTCDSSCSPIYIHLKYLLLTVKVSCSFKSASWTVCNAVTSTDVDVHTGRHCCGARHGQYNHCVQQNNWDMRRQYHQLHHSAEWYVIIQRLNVSYVQSGPKVAIRFLYVRLYNNKMPQVTYKRYLLKPPALRDGNMQK